MVSNDKEGLARVQEELGSKVTVKTFVADLSDIKVYENVWKEESKQDISILVNCVGAGEFSKYHYQNAEDLTK